MSAININKDNYIAEVLNSDKPVLLDFWAPWCSHCRVIMPAIDEIAAERSDIKVCKINVEDEMDLAQQFEVMSIPTLAVVKDGQVVNRSVGAKSKAAILQMF